MYSQKYKSAAKFKCLNVFFTDIPLIGNKIIEIVIRIGTISLTYF